MDRDWMATYECDLLAYGTEALSQVADGQLMGTAKEKAAILAFVAALDKVWKVFA